MCGAAVPKAIHFFTIELASPSIEETTLIPAQLDAPCMSIQLKISVFVFANQKKSRLLVSRCARGERGRR